MECLEAILSREDAFPNAKDVGENTALHWAAMRGNQDAVEMLLHVCMFAFLSLTPH